MSGKNIYFTESELKALHTILGTYLNASGVDYAVDEEYQSLEHQFDAIQKKLIKSLKK